jgi:serine/threonine protein kinase
MPAAYIVITLVFALAAGLAGVLAFILLRDRVSDRTSLRRAPLRAEIVMLNGKQPSLRYALSNSDLQIGSDPSCQIQLQGAGIAPVHAVIRTESGAFVLQDKRSQNGTWSYGKRIFAATIQPGAQFQIGTTVFAVLQPGEALPPAAEHLKSRANKHTPADEAAADAMITTVGFEPLGQLGVGGQVTVYRARSKADGADLVVKYLNDAPDEYDRGYFKQKFKQQILIGLSIRHPRCVRVLGGDPAHQPPYLIEEFIPGGTLRDRLLRGRLSFDEARRITGELLDAMGYLHGKGIIHRDIKPSNVLLDADAHVKLTDFGLIRIAGSPRVTQIGMCLGTPQYMSLEQIRGDSQRIGPTSDLYSVGILAYELFTGRVPFDGATDAILDAHLKTRPPGVNEINPDVPERIASAIAKALEKDPARRFQSAREMASAIGYDSAFEPGLTQHHSAAHQPLRLENIASGKPLVLNNSPCMLTRALINPADTLISREHGQAFVADGQWRIGELPGRPAINGLYVNGVRVDEEGDIVQPGDQVRLGHTVLRVLDDSRPGQSPSTTHKPVAPAQPQASQNLG